MSHRVFVYGTLKQGFPNAHVMKGRRVSGRFVTVERLALFLMGEGHVPWLLGAGEAGVPGEHVEGELYEVAAEDMQALDTLEDIGQPLGYVRAPITVRRLGPAGEAHTADTGPVVQAEVFQAEVYMQRLAHLNGQRLHTGPLSVYTLTHAQHFHLD